MKYIYIIIDRESGFVFGAYASRVHARKVFDELVKEGAGKELSLSQEPIITEPASYTNK